MKQKLLMLLLGGFLLGGLGSCSNKEDQPLEVKDVGQVEFGIEINEKTATKAGGCLSDEEIQLRIAQGKLKASITVHKATKPEQEMITINVRQANGKIVADPIELPRGSNMVHELTIHNEAKDTIFFSSVAAGSRYEQYVEETLPKEIVIDDSNIYTKSSIDLYVLCAVSENSEDFGYIKWNIHFITLYCLPFSVNVCNDLGEDITGVGTLKIEKGNFVNDQFTNAVTLSDISFPPATPGTLSDLCFPYKNQDDPAHTYFRLTMSLEGKRPVSSVVTLADLLDYKQRPEWNEEFNYLHFSFCDKNSWFFPNEFIRFAVRNCPDDQDETDATGKIKIYQNANPAGSTFVKGALVDEVNYPSTSTSDEIVIPNNYLIDDDNELYLIEVYTQYKGVLIDLPVSKVISVTELMQYKDSDAWDLVNRVLKINLCDCSSWIFPCQKYVLGSYVFEDLWPAPGDYDFNDLVVEYRASKILNAQNMMTSLELDCDLIALGAGYRNNAFAIRLDGLQQIANNHTVIRTCDARDGNGYQPYTITGNFWNTLDGQKVEITPDNVFVIPIIEKTDQQFKIMQTGTAQINVFQNAPSTIGQGYKYRLKVNFTTPISPDFKINPMLIVQANRTLEINMPLVKPTANCNYQARIGVDPNNPGNHKFYTYGANYRPWVMDVPYLKIRYAREGNSILTLYNPEFDVWCSSLYTTNPDWWLKPGVPTNFFFNPAAYPGLP